MKKTSREREPGTRRSRFLSFFGFLNFLGLGAWIYLQHELSPVDSEDRQPVQVSIQRGEGVSGIAKTLAGAGLVRSQRLFLIAVQLSGKAGELQAGDYALSRSMSAERMIDKIAAGRTDSEAVTIPEGFTADQIAVRLSSKSLCDKIAFLKVVATEGNSYEFADGFAPPRNLEGYLYPLTYNIVKSSQPHDIVKQMVDGFDRNIFSEHPEVHDWAPIVIVASLVEREAFVDSDRPLIASVYYNRLRIGMPLQCDATVQYALPEHKTRLMFSDLRVNSPYNTYLHRGLPPGPICNPGDASIEAAIDPASTDYLFYVAGPNGVHVFSRTLAQQDIEIAALRKKT